MSTNKFSLGFAAFIVSSLLCPMSNALNILVTNDDGFETPNINAVYQALKTEGHDVIVVGPYVGQSGNSGSLPFLRPIGPTGEDSELGTVLAGSPGTGSAPNETDIFYVNGTPAGAVLFGIDVIGKDRFGGNPDLVVSGPNEGQNVGEFTLHSGTIGAAVTAMARGIPAIAYSASRESVDDGSSANIAQVLVTIINALGTTAPVLPSGVGLNVNVPDLLGADLGALEFKFTKIGVATNLDLLPAFTDDLGSDPVATGFGIPAGLTLPGVTLSPTASLEVTDDDPLSEGPSLATGKVTISVIDGSYNAFRSKQELIKVRLFDLFNSGE